MRNENIKCTNTCFFLLQATLFSSSGSQAAISIHEYAPTFSASTSISAYCSAWKLFLCILEDIVVKAAWLEPHGSDARLFGLLQQLLRHSGRCNNAQSRLLGLLQS
jgi:hypothetical protein